MTLADRLRAVQAGVADAARQAQRDPAGITIIVVTKFHPAGVVRELHALGVRDFGENRHQEARAKAAELADLELNWHFVGQLQSNKARQARAYASVIHSVDRISLIAALQSDTATVDCFIQVALADEQTRGGARMDNLAVLAERVRATHGLRLLGVMGVAPLDTEPRRAFARLQAASQRVSVIDPAATFISAGMSGDYREAILEGATHLRIGTAITGIRPTHG